MTAWWMEALPTRFNALIVANGTPPKKAVYHALRLRSDHVIALDGGLQAIREWKEAPEYLVGDLDSVRRADLAWANSHGTRVHAMASQSNSDLDKGLSFCKRKQWKHVLLLGVDGDRLDHVLNSLSAASAVKGLSITLVTQQMLIFVMRGKAECSIDVPKRHTVSWFGLPEARGCTLEGVKWPLKRRILKLGGQSSLSNLPEAKTVTAIQVSGASLFMVSLSPKPVKRLLLSQ